MAATEPLAPCDREASAAPAELLGAAARRLRAVGAPGVSLLLDSGPAAEEREPAAKARALPAAAGGA